MKKSGKPQPLKGDTLGKRIVRRLEKLGKTATGVSIASGSGEDLIRNILRKEAEGIVHKMRSDKLTAVAHELSTTPEWLLTGQGIEDIDEIPEDFHIESDAILSDAPPAPTVPLIGYVSAGSQAVMIPLPSDDFDRVQAPFYATSNTRALEIRGHSLGELFDRWLVFFDDVRRPITADLYNRLCIVGLADGRIVVKKVRHRDGSYDLLSNNEPPMEGVSIEWAAKVIGMEPR